MPPKMDNPQADVERIRNAEVRATVCREHRRGLTQKNIAGALGLTVAQVQRILNEDLERLTKLPDKLRNGLAKNTPHGESEKLKKHLDLKERLMAVRQNQTRQIIDMVDSNPDFTLPRLPSPPPPPEERTKPDTITNYPFAHSTTIYSDHPQEQLIILRQKVFDLRKQGKTYEYICRETGTDFTTARRWVSEQLCVLGGDELLNRDLARRMQLERLDALLSAAWANATREATEEFPLQGPDLEAIRVVLRVMEQQAKLLGLNALPKVDIEERVRTIARRWNLDEDEMIEYAQEAIRVRVLPND